MIVVGKTNLWIKRILSYLLLLLACVIVLIPIVWFVSTSFKPYVKTIEYPPKWIPDPFTLENYSFILFGSNAMRYVMNSLIVSGMTIIFTLILAAHIAYATARYKFRFKTGLKRSVNGCTQIITAGINFLHGIGQRCVDNAHLHFLCRPA